jgi:hypothetical protein
MKDLGISMIALAMLGTSISGCSNKNIKSTTRLSNGVSVGEIVSETDNPNKIKHRVCVVNNDYDGCDTIDKKEYENLLMVNLPSDLDQSINLCNTKGRDCEYYKGHIIAAIKAFDKYTYPENYRTAESKEQDNKHNEKKQEEKMKYSIQCSGKVFALDTTVADEIHSESKTKDEVCVDLLSKELKSLSKEFEEQKKIEKTKKELFTYPETLKMDVVITGVQPEFISYRTEQSMDGTSGILAIKYVITKVHDEEIVFLYTKRTAVISGNATVHYRELKDSSVNGTDILNKYYGMIGYDLSEQPIQAYGIIEDINKLGSNESKTVVKLEKPQVDKLTTMNVIEYNQKTLSQGLVCEDIPITEEIESIKHYELNSITSGMRCEQEFKETTLTQKDTDKIYADLESGLTSYEL